MGLTVRSQDPAPRGKASAEIEDRFLQDSGARQRIAGAVFGWLVKWLSSRAVTLLHDAS
jgi:hypothetical protein